jgi:hypothetical protein
MIHTSSRRFSTTDVGETQAVSARGGYRSCVRPTKRKREKEKEKKRKEKKRKETKSLNLLLLSLVAFVRFLMFGA